jgi:hypothetical protein
LRTRLPKKAITNSESRGSPSWCFGFGVSDIPLVFKLLAQAAKLRERVAVRWTVGDFLGPDDVLQRCDGDLQLAERDHTAALAQFFVSDQLPSRVTRDTQQHADIAAPGSLRRDLHAAQENHVDRHLDVAVDLQPRVQLT